MWSYQVKLYEERELAVLDVMREEGGVTVNTIPSLTNHTQSVILAQVLQADNPVLDARVTATISGPGGDISLQLRDNGLASPDVTEGDGVYSAFIQVFARYTGYHSVRVSVESQEETSVNTLRGVGGEGGRCCGSSVGRGERRRTEDHIGGSVK